MDIDGILPLFPQIKCGERLRYRNAACFSQPKLRARVQIEGRV